MNWELFWGLMIFLSTFIACFALIAFAIWNDNR
jgi:hypothetical protein